MSAVLSFTYMVTEAPRTVSICSSIVLSPVWWFARYFCLIITMSNISFVVIFPIMFSLAVVVLFSVVLCNKPSCCFDVKMMSPYQTVHNPELKPTERLPRTYHRQKKCVDMRTGANFPRISLYIYHYQSSFTSPLTFSPLFVSYLCFCLSAQHSYPH